MIHYLSQLLAKKLIMLTKKNNDTIDDFLILTYGIECIIHFAIPIFFYSLYAYFTHQFKKLLCFLLSFFCLRNFIGGFHAASHMRCLFYSTLYGLFFLWLLTTPISLTWYIKLFIYLFMFLILSLLHPICPPKHTTRLTLYATITLFAECMFSLSVVFPSLSHLGNACFYGSCAAFLCYLLHFATNFRSSKRVKSNF